MSARLGSAAIALAGALVGCSAPATLPELAEAERLEREGRYEQALAAYERAATTCHAIHDRQRRRARCAEAHLHRAQLLEREGRPREAAEAYLEIPDAVEDPQASARATYHAGRLALERGEHTRGYDLLWQTITHYPDELAADDALKLVADDGRQRAPRELYRVLRELWGPLADTEIAPDLIFAMAEIAEEELGDRRAALALYDELVARHPESGVFDNALWRAGGLARELGDAEGALSRYQKLLETQEKLPFGMGTTRSHHLDDAFLERGRILRDELSDYPAAAAVFRELPETFPHSRLHDDALFERARTWADAGEDDRACAALAQLASEWPESRYELERAPALRRELGCEP